MLSRLDPRFSNNVTVLTFNFKWINPRVPAERHALGC